MDGNKSRIGTRIPAGSVLSRGERDYLDMLKIANGQVTPEVLADVIDISSHPRFKRYN